MHKMKLKIPNRIVVGEDILKIKWINRFRNKQKKGEINCRKKEILLEKGNKDVEITIIHEVCHYIIWKYLKTKSKVKTLKEGIEQLTEELTYGMFTLIYQIYK